MRVAALFCVVALTLAGDCHKPTGPAADPQILWFHKDLAGAAARPYADSELAVFTNEFDMRVVALDAKTGAVRWEQRIPTTPGVPFHGMPHANIVAAGDLLIVPAWDIFALDRRTGAIRWEFEQPDDYPGWGEVSVANGRVYAAAWYLYSIDAQTGVMQWRVDVGQESATEQAWRPIETDGIVYLSTKPAGNRVDSHVVAVEAVTGTVLWRFSLAGSGPGNSGSIGPPAIRDSVLVIACENRKVYALDRRTGQLRWTYEGSGNPYSAGAVILDNTVVTGVDAAEGLDLATGQLLWRWGPIGTVLVPITPAEGTALISSAVVYAFDANGKIRWRYGGERWGQPVFTTAATYYHGAVFVGSVSPERPGAGFYAIRVPE
jgi:outer membrane protein assembly factor BamB